MNSRERVLVALKHKEPDHVPFDLGGTVTSGIHYTAYRNLLNYLGYEDREVKIVEIIQQLADVHEDILKKLKVDVRPIYGGLPSNWSLKIKDEEKYTTFIDQWGIGWKKPKKNGLYYDLNTHPFADMTEPNEIKNYKFPAPEDPIRFKGVRERAKKKLNTSNAVLALAGVSAGFLEMAYWLRGYEQFFIDLCSNRPMVEAILDKTVENKIRYWKKALEEFGDLVDIVIEADDFASQRGMIISPDMYRKFIKPRQQRLFSEIKNSRKDVFIFFHSCGSVYDIIPDLIEVGIDALNPVQVSAVNMDSKKLKKEFGNDITFWGGGIDTQNILSSGSPEEVKDETKRRINDFAPGGGFIFTPVHNVQADVPPENYMAMWEVWEEYGKH